MLVISWRKERTQDWYQEYQVSGCDVGWGASQQETPRTGEELVVLLSVVVVSVSLATWKMALFMPQQHRAARES